MSAEDLAGRRSGAPPAALGALVRAAWPLNELRLAALGEGISTRSKSRGATVLGKTSRASSRTADVVAGGDVDDREHVDPRILRQLGGVAGGRVAGLRGPADSSTAKVPSWTSSCAAWAATRVISQGAVSPVIATFRPCRGSPITWSGVTSEPFTEILSPLWSRPKSRSSVIPRPARSRRRSGPDALARRTRAERPHPVLDRERAHLEASCRSPPRRRARSARRRSGACRRSGAGPRTGRWRPAGPTIRSGACRSSRS